MHPDALTHARDRYRHRTRHLRGHATGVVDGPVEAKAAALERLTRELLGAERRELLRLRDQGAIGDTVMRRIQRDLDYEELLLHPE
jgi:CPA1 family monovalent cation:H+ antiporter